MSEFSFLPNPRLGAVVLNATDGIPAGFHPDIDRYVADAGALIAAVMASFNDLEDSRPGGARWQDALRADGDALVAGKLPAKTAVEQLLAGDGHRWAVASAQARTIGARVAQLRARVDNPAVAKAMTGLADDLAMDRRPRLAAAWAAITGADDLECRNNLKVADQITDRIVLATRLARWCGNANPAEPFNKVVGVQYPGPQGKRDHGLRFACRLELGERIITLPVAGHDIEWPRGFKLNGESVAMTFPVFDADGTVRQPVSVPAVL